MVQIKWDYKNDSFMIEKDSTQISSESPEFQASNVPFVASSNSLRCQLVKS